MDDSQMLQTSYGIYIHTVGSAKSNKGNKFNVIVSKPKQIEFNSFKINKEERIWNLKIKNETDNIIKKEIK